MILAATFITGYLVIITFLYEKNVYQALKLIIFFGVFIWSALFLLNGNHTSEVFYFIMVCVLWLPLSIDDLKSKSVNRLFLYLSSLLSCSVFLVFWFIEPISLIICLFLVIFLYSTAWIMKISTNRQAIGPADYFSIFSLSVSLPVYSIGPWVILFSLLGITHSLLNERGSIPLIPFLFSGWCLVYAMS